MGRPTHEIIAAISHPPKGKAFKKKRMGVRAAKHVELQDQGGAPLGAEAATQYRALAARCNYLSMDRPDIGFAAKELCRDFAQPSAASVVRLKRVVRYLVHRPRLVWHFGFEDFAGNLDVHVDTDFAGCIRTRWSTSGGLARLGSHVIKGWSNTQSTVALSSAESELTGICKGATISLGLQALCQDLGLSVALRIFSDSTAAIGICRRRGLGRVRHLAVADLWIQDRLRSGDFSLSKVLGSENVADIMTKMFPKPVLNKHLEALSLRDELGRPSSAAQIP